MAAASPVRLGLFHPNRYWLDSLFGCGWVTGMKTRSRRRSLRGMRVFTKCVLVPVTSVSCRSIAGKFTVRFAIHCAYTLPPKCGHVPTCELVNTLRVL
jgi:hypothetical protein